MRLIFDISVLGNGFYQSTSRTGVFRVIENLAQELVKMEAVTSFSSTFNIGSYFECIDYLKSNPALEGVRLASPDISKDIQKAYQYLHVFTHKNNNVPLCVKKINKIVNGAANRTFLRKTINQDDLTRAELYHSPFYPFPEQIKTNHKLKKVITVYDLIPVLFPEFFKNQQNGLINEVLKSIDNDTWVTCISDATKSDLCNYLPSLDPSRVVVTHLAASSLFYPCRDQAKLGHVRKKYSIPEGPYLLSLSTLEPRKNISQTIRSFARLVEEEKINDLSLVLVGTKGWSFDSIFDEIVASQKIRDRIIVTGYAADDDLASLYSGAMMFVYPSFYEGFGLPPLEAMQCGVPVITSNTSSLPEVVGNAGIMVSPEDGDALSHAMLTIYNSDELRKQMTTDALSQAAKFSWENCAEQTIETYKAAMAG